MFLHDKLLWHLLLHCKLFFLHLHLAKHPFLQLHDIKPCPLATEFTATADLTLSVFSGTSFSVIILLGHFSIWLRENVRSRWPTVVPISYFDPLRNIDYNSKQVRWIRTTSVKSGDRHSDIIANIQGL